MMLAAFLPPPAVGYACIYFLLAWLRSHSLYIFAAYCALLGGGYLAVDSLFFLMMNGAHFLVKVT